MIVMSKQKCIKTLQSIEATQQNKRRVPTKHKESSSSTSLFFLLGMK